jgi:hypothetical protein
MRPALLLLLLAAGCREQSPHGVTPPPSDTAARPAPPSGSAGGGPVVSADQAACADRWLSEHKLDPYGNPQGTSYLGGTPTFDERTGQTIDRWVLVAKNRPEALRTCGVALP